MQDKILKKILKKLNDPDLLDKLVNQLSFSELQSLLMIAFNEKRKSIKIKDMLDQYKKDPYLFPSGVEQGLQIEFDSIISNALPKEFTTIELSPVSPLGSCSQIAGISQNKIISTIRKNEVSSDPTNILALEASLRRKETNKTIRLSTSQRVLRSERVVSKDTVAHFRVYALCIAGKDKGNLGFEIETCQELILLYIKVLQELNNNGYQYLNIKVIVKCNDRAVLDALESCPLKKKLNEVNTIINYKLDEKENWNYYRNIRFQINVTDNEGEYFIVDGGDTDWTQQILSNKKERFFISGFGSERFMMIFKP